MNKLLLVIGVVALVALCFGVLSYLRQEPPLGAAGIGANHYTADNFLQGLYAGTTGQFLVKNTGAVSSSAALSVSGKVTISGASSTVSGVNLIINSTSTGLVLRAADGNCYLLSLGTGGAFATSSASCQ